MRPQLRLIPPRILKQGIPQLRRCSSSSMRIPITNARLFTTSAAQWNTPISTSTSTPTSIPTPTPTPTTSEESTSNSTTPYGVSKGPKKPYFITTPIFYVNAEPHIGHLYTMVMGDILKRWQNLLGNEAILVTGTDEHGMKVQQAAEVAGEPPASFCDIGANQFRTLATTSRCNIDIFQRTTTPEHADAVTHFWRALHARDYIYERKHQGWYSVSDETFYPSSQIETVLDPATGRKISVSRETGNQVEWTSEVNWHFRLSSMRDRLLEFYKQNPRWVVPANRYASIVAEVEKGLEDLSISRLRSRLSWGIEVPGDDSQTVYVWLDALVNYLTASGYPWTPGRETEGGWPADVHVVGKDILKFHCIYWPAFLLALDLPLPKKILSHAHWTINKRKMSKSDGSGVKPFYAMDRFGIDALRYYLTRHGGIQDDADYSNEWIVSRYKKELQGGFGNLVNRVCGGRFNIRGGIDDYVARGRTFDGWELDGSDVTLMSAITIAREDVHLKMQRLDVPGALSTTVNLMSMTNRYLQTTQPWLLPKLTKEKLQNHRIFLATEALRIAVIMLQPVIPQKAAIMLDRLAVSEDRRGWEWAEMGKDTLYGAGTRGRVGVKTFPALPE